MEDIAFSDWPGQAADPNTGNNPWLPAYGFQTPSALLEKEDFIGNPDAEYFLQNSIGYMYLETIQEETSDDLRSESDLESRGSPVGWFETDSDTGSVIRTNGPDYPDGDLGELACPAKRRKQETVTLLSVVNLEDEDSLSRSSSLLQFETLEKQCLEPVAVSPNIFAFDSFGSNVSPDSLDADWEKESHYYKSLNIDVIKRKDKSSSRDSLLYNSSRFSGSEGSDTSEGTLEPSRSFDNLKTWKSFDSLPLVHTNNVINNKTKEKSTENLSEDSGYSDHLVNKSFSGNNLGKQLETAMKSIDENAKIYSRKKRNSDGFGAYDGEVFHHINGNFGVSYQDLSVFEKYEPCEEYRSPLISRFIKNKMHQHRRQAATTTKINIDHRDDDDDERAKYRSASASEPNLIQAASENLIECLSVPKNLNLVGDFCASDAAHSVAVKNWDLADLSVECNKENTEDMAKVKREGSYDMAMTNRVDLTDDEDSFTYRKLPKTPIVEFDKKVLKAISEQSIQSIIASSTNLTEAYLNDIYSATSLNDIAKSTPNLMMNENELIDRYLEEERRKSTLDVRRKNSIIKSSTSTSGMSDLEDKTLTSCSPANSRGVHFSPVVSEVNWRDDDSASTATPERESSVYSFESTPEKELAPKNKKLSSISHIQRLSMSQPELSDTENCKRDFEDSLKSLRQDLSKSQPDMAKLRRKGSVLVKKDEHGALVQAYVDRDGIQYKHTHLDLGVFQNASAPAIGAPHQQPHHHQTSSNNELDGGAQSQASRNRLSHANDMEAQHAHSRKEKKAKLGGFFSRLASFRFSNRKSQEEKNKLKKKDAPKPQGIQMPHQRIATKEDYIYIPLKGPTDNNNGPSLAATNNNKVMSSFAGKPPLPKQPPPRVVHASVKREAAAAEAPSVEKPRRRRRTTIDSVPRMEEQPMGLIETDLDTEVTVITSGCGNVKTRSLLNLGLGDPKGAVAAGQRSLHAPEEARGRPHKSMEFLLDKQNLKVVEPPENELQKGDRVMSEHQLRFQRSLQKLTVPEWCKQSQLPREGFLLNKHTRQRESRWTGTGSHTNSLTNLGQQQLNQSSLAAPPSPASHFVRWSTSRLNSTASSPCASTRSSFKANGSISPSSVRSSFSYRQPYMGWRSQERIAHPKTPAERLANSMIVDANPLQNSPELQNSIKEVTSAIVHYMSHLEGQEFPSHRSSSASPRGSQKLCWLESSFVGVKPVDSPQTPVTLSESQSTTPVPQSNLQLDLQSQNDLTLLTATSGRLSPSSTTLEDVLDSLLGLPSAGGSGRAPSPSLQGTVSANTSPCRLGTLSDHTDQFRRRSEGSEPGGSLSTGVTVRKVSLNTSPVLKCRFSHCGRTALANSEEAAFYKSCHNCSFMYCSRTCRRAHWEKHRRTCLFSRIGTLCRQVIAACKEQKDTLLHLSTIARRGYLSHGLGAVKLFFACPEFAEKFLFRGFQNLGELTYVRWQDLLPSEMGTNLYAELVQMCKNYNPDTRFVLYVSICAVSETPATGAIRWERQLVSRCGRLKLSKDISIPEKDQEPLETLVLTCPKIQGSPETIKHIREMTVYNLQLHLLERGVNIRTQHPDIFHQLKIYSEGTVKFIPVNVYQVDSQTGKNFMCIIMLEADTESLNKIKTAGVQVKTIDVLSTPLPE